MQLRFATISASALMSPAALFLGALMVRNVTSQQHEPARAAQQVVLWYADRMWTLWVLLLALPCAALIIGCAAMQENWSRHTGLIQFARQSCGVVLATIAAAGTLGVVVLHMLAN